MASIEDGDKSQGAPEGQKQVRVPNRRFVSIGEPLANVLKWDTAGEELIFEHEKGKFMRLTPSDLLKLHHENRVRYSVSESTTPSTIRRTTSFRIG
jgi:hypothetical protein